MNNKLGMSKGVSGGEIMRIAMPILNGQLSAHFGHAPKFAIVDVENGQVVGSQLVDPPPHEPGVLPRWLGSLGVTHVLCGGIGARAVEMLNSVGITVVAGVSEPDPTRALEAFLAGSIQAVEGPTCTGHEHGHGGGCRH